jgi:aspartyl protease family protein
MWKQVAPLFVIAVLIGWLMPVADPVAAPQMPAVTAASSSPATPPATSQAQVSASYNSEHELNGVVLDRHQDGHFYARANANGTDLNLLVDTGASVVALTAADAEKLGLYWHPGELSLVGRGVSGEVMGKRVMIERLSVGDISAEKISAVIIPTGLEVSLLGQSFLARIKQVTINENRMTLKN